MRAAGYDVRVLQQEGLGWEEIRNFTRVIRRV